MRQWTGRLISPIDEEEEDREFKEDMVWMPEEEDVIPTEEVDTEDNGDDPGGKESRPKDEVR